MRKFWNTEFIISFFLPIVGLACIFFSNQITGILPVILGPAMIVTGAVRFVGESILVKRGDDTPPDMGTNFMFVVIGTLFLLRKGDPYVLIGVLWGLIGVWQSAVSFQRAIKKIRGRENALLDIGLSVFRLVLGVLLLLEPERHGIAHHVIILGLDILVDTARRPIRRLWELLRGEKLDERV